jgi:hypothetical protein
MADKFVVDTNVAINANGKDGKGNPAQGSPECQLICIKWLMNCENTDIVLDDADLIMAEYAKHLNYKGQPNIGDMFFKYLHNYQHTSDKIHRVTITPLNEEKTEFAELKKLNANLKDLSDRKFLATAVKSQAIIVNATDSDWTEQKVLLDSLNIEVQQLCPEHRCK